MIVAEPGEDGGDELLAALEARGDVRIVLDEALGDVAVEGLRLALVEYRLDELAIELLVGLDVGGRGRCERADEQERDDEQRAHGDLLGRRAR